jgi:hypothetical protein
MMADQLQLQTITNQVIQKAERGANPAWKTAVREAILTLCKNQDSFTADDVMEIISKLPVKTRTNNAMGAMIRAAALNGLCTFDGDIVLSKRLNAHSHILRVWRSLLR